MVKVLIASDKFKTTLSSAEISRSLKNGFLEILPQAQIREQVVSDGGEGFLDALQASGHLRSYPVKITGPLGREVNGFVLFDSRTSRVYIESCQATGFHLLEADQRNPFLTTSKGLAQLFIKALSLDPGEIYIGLGSSATCDGGIGFAAGLGYCFLDVTGQELPAIPESLSHIATIQSSETNTINTTHVKVYGVVDVLNPPLGPNGGVQVYSPQKGATPEQVKRLEDGMKHYLHLLEDLSQNSLQNLVGGGAAGCLGMALNAYLQAQLLPGSQWLIQQLELEHVIQGVDILITGEGDFDQQSLAGKIPFTLMELAKKYAKKCVLVTGKKTILKELPCQSTFSIESLIEQGQINGIEESERGLYLIGQSIAKLCQNGLL